MGGCELGEEEGKEKGESLVLLSEPRSIPAPRIWESGARILQLSGFYVYVHFMTSSLVTAAYGRRYTGSALSHTQECITSGN